MNRPTVTGMAKRLALVIGVLALLAIAFLALVPAKPGGVHCGSLVNPDYTRSQARHLVKMASDLYDKAQDFDVDGEFAAQGGHRDERCELLPPLRGHSQLTAHVDLRAPWCRRCPPSSDPVRRRKSAHQQ